MSTDNDNLEPTTASEQAPQENKEGEAKVVEPRIEEAKPERSRGSVEDILGAGLIEQSRYAGEKLKTLIAGKVLVRLSDTGRNFLIDWSEAQLSSKPIKSEEAKSDSGVECTISLSEGDLKRIQRGDLNPQIAMLSDKIRVEGRKSSAIYLFNLIAPRSEVAR